MSAYFQGLNYSLANEDTWVEHQLLPTEVDSIFTVCGSGSRVLPLIAKNPGQIHVVDLSETQLKLFRLRLAAAKNLSPAEFHYLLGYTQVSPLSRSQLMAKLPLSPDDQNFWKSQESAWQNAGFIYLGKWERHFMKMGKYFQLIPGVNVAPLFEAKDLTEQKEIIKKYWKPAFFKFYTKVVLNEWISNKLLYKGSYAGAKAARTTEMSTADFVFSEFNDLFHHTWVRSNYFLNMIFLNQVTNPECFPAECDPEILAAVRASKSQVQCHQRDLLSLLNEKPHDFYSLSDTFSYMKDQEVGAFLSQLPKEIKTNSQMVIRTFMRKPKFAISAPWVTDPVLNKALAKKDCTRVYEFTWLKKS